MEPARFRVSLSRRAVSAWKARSWTSSGTNTGQSPDTSSTGARAIGTRPAENRFQPSWQRRGRCRIAVRIEVHGCDDWHAAAAEPQRVVGRDLEFWQALIGLRHRIEGPPLVRGSSLAITLCRLSAVQMLG